MKTKRLSSKTDFEKERHKEQIENILIAITGAILAGLVFIGGLN